MMLNSPSASDVGEVADVLLDWGIAIHEALGRNENHCTITLLPCAWGNDYHIFKLYGLTLTEKEGANDQYTIQWKKTSV